MLAGNSLKICVGAGFEISSTLRTKCLDKHKSSAMGIVYVLDASTITKNIRDVTEYLFQILSDPTIHGNRTSVLIVCNKQDMTLAKGSTGKNKLISPK